MKKKHFSLIALAALMTTGLFTVQSCGGSTDDGELVIDNSASVTNPNNWQGEITAGQSITLNPNVEYKLNGAIIVKNGGTLNIPAGTRIVGIGGTSSYVTIEQGGKINATGTASSPIVFTSSSAVPGSWGGIVICGKAPINKGATATSEVGNGIYGGTVTNDNSGVMQYVRIEYAGALFTPTKEFNGLSLFGVGNGTTIDHVSMINGSDDGIEFFGGTVNVTNIVSVGNEDDMFDWTEGWTGTASYLYGKRRANGTGNRGFEGDNNSNDNSLTPMSNPQISHVTLIGDLSATNTELDGMKLREGTNAMIDDVVLSNWKTGINIEHNISLSNLNGTSRITNIKFDNVTTPHSGKDSNGNYVTLSTSTYTMNNNALGAGNGTAVPSWAAGWAGI